MAIANYLDSLTDEERANEPEMTCCTATSSNDDEYFKNREEGYKDGYKYAIKEMNERLFTWLTVGMLIGLVVGFLAVKGFWFN